MEEKSCQRKNLVRKENIDHRLKKNTQFNYIYRKGERVSSKHFVLFMVKSRYPNYKIGYAVSKKIGKAWKRNLLRRRLKEIVRINSLCENGKNYILLSREGAGDIEFKVLENEILKLFEKGKRLGQNTKGLTV